MNLGTALVSLVFSVFFTCSAWSQPEEEGENKGKVLVEPTYVVPAKSQGTLTLAPYKDRRGEWGYYLGAAYSTFVPKNYEPDGVSAEFTEAYGEKSYSLISLRLNVKRNFSWGALGLESTFGMYSKSSRGDFSGSEIDLKPVKVGAQLILDMLFNEPYVAPYIGGGGYVMIYEETRSGVEFGGSTQASAYLKGGLLLQLDWMDPITSRDSFHESGIQNSFLFIEAEQLFSSQAVQDPDFSSLYGNTGIQLEF